VYTYDIDTGIYTGPSQSAPAQGSGCNNVLKEVVYHVSLEKSGGDGSSLTTDDIYYINEVTADIVL